MKRSTHATGGQTPSEVVQMLIHGVSGSDASVMLDTPDVHQVAGDRGGGFYRPRRRCCGSGSGVTLEAYRWSELPGGTVTRSLSYVLLLPFMLANLAVWMRPGDSPGDSVTRSVCRILGLTLTALYVLAIVGVSLDLVAWQCLSVEGCIAGRSWLSWLGGRPVGMRLAVLALIPAAAIGVVWRGSARPKRTIVSVRQSQDAEDSGHLLGRVGRGEAGAIVGRLRSIHVAGAFATLDVSLLAARATPRASAYTAALAAVALAILAGCVAFLSAPGLIEPSGAHLRLDRLARMLRTAALSLSVVVVIYVLFTREPWPTDGGLPGYGSILTCLFVGQTVLLTVLGAVLLRRRHRQQRQGSVRGLGALAACAAATSISVVFSAVLVYRVTDYLDRNTSTAQRLIPGPPRPFTWAIYGFFRAVVITIIIAALVNLATRRSRLRTAAAILARDFPNPPWEARPRLREVQSAIARARFTDLLVLPAAVYAFLAGVGLATTTAGLMRLYPGDLLEQVTMVPAGFISFDISFGSWVAAAVILSVVIGAVFAYRTPVFRRHVSVLWDLGTFWPRVAHPFAPPCYAERALPELVQRITFLVDRGNVVLLAGHSHGSVLLTATVLQLPSRVLDRIALLTYGSPLRRFYARLFPAYVNTEMLHEVGSRVGWRWLNLWHDTDAFGGWMFSGHRLEEPPQIPGPAASVDRRQRDPEDLVAVAGDSVPPPIDGHWRSTYNKSYVEARRELIGRLSQPSTSVDRLPDAFDFPRSTAAADRSDPDWTTP